MKQSTWLPAGRGEQRLYAIPRTGDIRRPDRISPKNPSCCNPMRRDPSLRPSQRFGTNSGQDYNARAHAHFFLMHATLVTLLACALSFLCALDAHAQGMRKDDIVFGPQGRPVAGANVAICTQPASTTTTPCSPLAGIFSDPGLTQPLANPTKTDGLGNYHFYASPGKYTVQVYGSGLTTTVIPDVTVPNDPMNPSVSTITSSGGVSAFTLTLGGNLTVGGNASVTGSLTAGTLNVSNFNPTQITVTGPRPRVDVTAYGAKGDGVTDDTAAIQAAINAACSSGATGGGSVFFPPTSASGLYKTLQPQSPNNGPVFTIPVGCTGLHLIGGNGYLSTAGQFSRAPMVRITVTPGASPGLGPVFLVNQNSTTIENLSITGYNQAVQVNNCTQFTMRNFYLGISDTNRSIPSDATDNCALCIYNMFWALIDQGSITTPNPVRDWAIVMAQVAGAGQNNAGLYHFNDIVETGPNLFDVRTNVTAVAGTIEFNWVQTESVNGPWLTIMENGGNQTVYQGPISSLRFVNLFDCSGSNVPLVALKAPVALFPPNFYGSSSNCSSAGPLLKVFGTTYPGATVANSGGIWTQNAYVDENNSATAPYTEGNTNGTDYITNISDGTRFRTDWQTVDASPGTTGNGGTPARMIQKGKTQANLGIDPVGGVLFGDATNPGYSAALNQSTLGALDVQIAQQMPPTSLSATPAGGGSCAANTYYYKVYSQSTGFSASWPSLEVSSVVGANGKTTLNWIAALGSNVGGYRIFRNSNSANFWGTQAYYDVMTGQATNSFVDTCAAPTGNGAPPVTGTLPASTFRVTGSSPHIDVTAYGAKCDGVTNDKTAIQNAINAAPANGAAIFFPPGSCYITTGLSTTGKNLVLRGAGGGWSGANASEIISDQAIVLLTFGTGSSTTQNGPLVEHLGFRDSSAGNNTVLGAINLVREDFWMLNDIDCSNITVGYCIQLDGTGDATQYGTILNPKARNVKFPLKTVTNASAISIFGGNFVCSGITGSIGIDIETSDTFTVDGTDLNNCLVDSVKIFQSNANHIHARFEQDAPNIGTGIAVLVDGSGVNGSNGNDVSFNSIVGFLTGISITANATKTRIDEPFFSNNTTNLSDSGVQSLIVTPGDQITLGAPPAVASTGMGFFTHTNVPGQGSANIPGLLLTNGYGAIAMQDKTTAGGFWFNGDQAGRGCLGAGLYGTCSFFAEFASNTSAAGIRFGNTAGQIDFFSDTGLTSGGPYSPNIRATISTAGIALGQAGSHLNTSVANNDLDGTITISSSTSGSHSFATNFSSAPVCTITPVSDPTAVGVWWATATTSAVTANVKISGTIAFNYHCIGNPN